jgi:hypothetical protein
MYANHGFKGDEASQGAGGAPQRLGAQGALQGDAFEACLLEAWPGGNLAGAGEST